MIMPPCLSKSRDRTKIYFSTVTTMQRMATITTVQRILLMGRVRYSKSCTRALPFLKCSYDVSSCLWQWRQKEVLGKTDVDVFKKEGSNYLSISPSLLHNSSRLITHTPLGTIGTLAYHPEPRLRRKNTSYQISLLP